MYYIKLDASAWAKVKFITVKQQSRARPGPCTFGRPFKCECMIIQIDIFAILSEI